MLNGVSLLFVISSVISLILSVYAFNRKQKQISISLSLILLGVSFWSFFYAIEIWTDSLIIKDVSVVLQFFGRATLPVMWVFYAAYYTRADSWLTLPRKILLFVIPFITILSVSTNDLHYLFYSKSVLVHKDDLIYHLLENGLFYRIHIVYSYIAILVGVIFFARMYIRVPKENRFHISIILTSLFIPVFVSLAHLTGFKPYGFLDLTPLGFLVMGMILMFGAFGTKLFDVTPLALTSLYDSIPDSIFVFDENYQIINTNPSAQQIITKYFNNENVKFIELIKSFNSNCYNLPEFKVIDLENSIFKILCKEINNKNGQFIGHMLIMSDVTLSKRVENKLKESEEQHRLLFETAQEIIVVAQDSKLVYYNPLFLKTSGYTAEEISSLNLLEVVHPDDRDLIVTNHAKRIAGEAVEKRYQFRLLNKNKDICWVDISSEKLMWDGKPATLNFMSDITESKKSTELQDVLIKIADRYINTSLDVLAVPISQSLQDIGEIVDADKICLFEYLWDDEICQKTSEWLNPATPHADAGFQYIPISIISAWTDKHKKNEAYYINNVSAEEDRQDIIEMLESQHIKSILTIPLVDQNICKGFITFEYVNKPHNYSDKEKTLLHMFAQMLVNLQNRKFNQDKINAQIESQRLINQVSTDFISADSENLELKIDLMLTRLGHYLNVDRTYVLKYSEDGWNESYTNEWCAPGIDAQIGNMITTDIGIYPWWKNKMDAKQVISVPDVSVLPKEAFTEKTEFERQHIKSLLCVPVINNKVIGFLGIDSVRKKNNWTTTQIELIQILSNILSDALIKVKSEIELKKSIMLAKAASIAKSDFLSNMSHEIRTPLNGVIGFTDLLRNTKLDIIQKDYLDNAISSANSLLGVISDILDFSKIEAGKLDLDLVKYDIVELVENTTDIIKVHAASKGLELLLNIQPDIPRFAVIDPIRLKQIIVNLLGNAIKFTLKGEVELRLSFEQIDEKIGLFYFMIRDTGIGIKDEDKSKLFKAFSQADTSTTRRYGGTGLGLIISNSLAKKMGGEIKFESECDKGSSFSFAIETQYETGEQQTVNSIHHVRKALVIDDNVNNRNILEHTFNNWNVSYTGVDSATNALELLQKKSDFDVILVDYHMPELNGIETIKLIQNQIGIIGQPKPFILLHSSVDNSEIQQSVKELNINATLIKPVKSGDLFECLNNLKDMDLTEVKSVTKNKEYKDELIQVYDTKVKILIAEDARMNMLVLSNMLKNFLPNVEIFEANNGEKALALLENITPHLILMDVQMPVMSGIVATERIKANKRKTIRDIPIIALTALVSKEERETCFKVGMIDFLSKPIDKKLLREKIITNIKHVIDFENDVANITEIAINEDKHFDKANLLQKIGNNNELYLTLINLAKVDYPDYFSKMKVATSIKDTKTLKSIAHTLKGSAYNMEFAQLGDLANEIELYTENIEELNKILTKMTTEWEKIETLL